MTQLQTTALHVNADAIAIAVSDLANVNRIEPVWNSIEAIVACSEEEWQVK